MAAVAKTRPVLVSPPGYELADVGYASEDIAAGDPLIITSATPPNSRWDKVLAKATGAVAHGVAAKDCGTGGTAEIIYQGEIDGFSGLTPGAGLSIASGAIDTTAPTGNAQIRALTPTRIRVQLV